MNQFTSAGSSDGCCCNDAWGEGRFFPVHAWRRTGGEKVQLHSYLTSVDSSWNVMSHGDAREGKWRGNWRMEWVASTLHTTSEHVVSSITTADAHISAASSRMNWRPRRFKWTRPFRRKTKSGFCACAITFQLASTRWRWVANFMNRPLYLLGGPQNRSGPLLEDGYLFVAIGIRTSDHVARRPLAILTPRSRVV